MRANLGERLADVGENGRSVFWIHFNDLSNKQDGLEGCKGRFALELEE